MNERFDVGGLLTSDSESIDLGEHHGHRLEGRVERRTLRLGIGGSRGFRFELARARATSIRIDGPTGELVQRVPANPDPWLAALARMAAMALATALLPWLFRRRHGFARQAAE
ncbi:MAG: hypothetical protein O3A10_12805 [Chloroflexi bacterium]|nr:hypothetical protein [Chloroflexota bacterium]MDA1145927.1 hypothetical protein [Chloroflexota bacterium]